MSLFRTLTVWSSFAVASLGFAPLVVAETAVLTVRADAWMPFNGDTAGERPGYVVEILRSVYEPLGVKVDYQTMAWADALEAAAKNEITAVIGANRKEATKLLLPVESVGEPRMGLFVRKDIRWAYTNLQSLEEVQLAAIEGYSYWESIDVYIKNGGKKVTFLTGETPLVDGLKKLDSGKVDVLVETFPVFVWAVKKSGRNVADYRVAFKQEGEPIYVAFASTAEGKVRAGQLDQGLRELRASGRLEAILKAYGLSDWKD